MKLKVIKDCYYISRENFDGNEYLGHEELMGRVVHMLVKGDVWETDKNNPEFFICVKSKNWLDELNDGWWEYKWVKDYFKTI
jgi:hypothetical protein